MAVNDLVHLYSVVYKKEYVNVTNALKDIAKEGVPTSHLRTKNERSFDHLARSNSLCIYFVYIPDIETFMRFHREFSFSDRYQLFRFIVICSDISKELMVLSYKYKIKALAFIDSAKSTHTCKLDIKECIDHVKVIQQHLDKKEENT
jgi:hypothetical protein